MSEHTLKFLTISSRIVEKLLTDTETNDQIDRMVSIIKNTKLQNGRLFIIGMGGGAGHASHAVNDFRKLCGVDAVAPTDNVSELTARANDEGLNTIFSGWLITSRLNNRDCLLVISVGGGDIDRNVSMAIVDAVTIAKNLNAKVIGILGRDGGYTAKYADACVIIPNPDNSLVTPQTEGMQALLWHLIVSNPELQVNKTKW
jgi:D-sedoheptulose 7-phosphate isomerase